MITQTCLPTIQWMRGGNSLLNSAEHPAPSRKVTNEKIFLLNNEYLSESVLSGNLSSATLYITDEEKGQVNANGTIGNVINIDKERKQLTIYIYENKKVIVSVVDKSS